MVPESQGGRPLTPMQIRTLDRLISVGASRPVSPSELSSELAGRLESGCAAAVGRWTERSLYLTKSSLLTIDRCEGQLLAQAGQPSSGVNSAAASGTATHHAIQLAFTHPGRAAYEYIRQAVAALRKSDEQFLAWWNDATTSEQSDLLVNATSRLTNFLDDFPPLQEAWNPRFEEPMVAKAGKLTLSCRPDLTMGRPRGDYKQTMLILDFKTGDIKDEHLHEARLYALIATLRHGVAPWRSTVYSLASGDYTDPDVTPEVLFETVNWVIQGVEAYVDVLTEKRSPVLSPGAQCRFCPARDTCDLSGVGRTDLSLPSPKASGR